MRGRLNGFTTEGKRIMKAAWGFLAIGCILVLDACGPSEPPRCGDKATETKLIERLFESLDRSSPLQGSIDLNEVHYIEGSNPNPGYNHTVHFAIDLKKMRQAFAFTFTNERERQYNQKENKRFCTANISVLVDKVRAAEAVAVTPKMDFDFHGENGKYLPLSDDQVREVQQYWVARSNVTWREPQNFSVRHTHSGEPIVTLDE